MKMADNHYQTIKAIFQAYDRHCVSTGQMGLVKFAATYRQAGLSPMRFRWDFFTHAGKFARDCKETGFLPRGSTTFIVDTLYPEGLNDDHIDTALRKAMRELLEDGSHWTAQGK